MFWPETPAGILAAQKFGGDDPEARARARAEEQREGRVWWEARMDAADAKLAEDKVPYTPWRVVRAAAEKRDRDWAAVGCMFEVPGSYIQFRPASWLNMERTTPPELAALFAAIEAANARVAVTRT